MSLKSRSLNKVTENIKDNNITFESTNLKERWDQLYNLNKMKNRKKENDIKESQLFKEKEEMKYCTFYPTVSTDNIKIADSNIFERQNNWIHIKNQKAIKLQNELNYRKQCIFKPILKSKSQNKSNSQSTESIVKNAQSYNIFLKRAEDVRERKIMFDKMNELTPGSGKIWTSSITIPKQFIFKAVKGNKKCDNSIDLSSSYYNTSNYKFNHKKSHSINSQFISDNSVLTKLIEDSKENNKLFKSPLKYGNAKNYLHDILHKID